jgi:ketosteroid isomerase-like protein
MVQEDVKAIRQLIEAHSEALRAKDAARILEPLAERVTLYELQPPLEYRDGAARDLQALEKWLDTWEGPVEVEMPDPAIAVNGDLAFAFGLQRMRGKKKGGIEKGGQVELWFRSTLCFERQRGQWRVVHQHDSVPFRMDGSEKAALDLKPEALF